MLDVAEDKRKQLPPGISVRKDGRYQARYTFNSKRHTIYGKGLKEIQKKLRELPLHYLQMGGLHDKTAKQCIAAGCFQGTGGAI